MNFKSVISCAVALLFLATASSADAHMAFKKQLQKKYVGMKVSCNACHVKGKPKTQRTDFGKLFSKEIQKNNPTLTADYKTKKGAEKKAFEKATVIPAFDKVLKVVKAAKNKQGETYDALIKAEKINEIKKDPKYKPTETGEKKSG